tara:strand:- start:803 stop:1387 length:585 start_codon:yes stop_codon:yes gene_type:complete
MRTSGTTTSMIKVYDNVIPDDVCQQLIEFFELNKDNQEYINHNNCPCFTQVNLNQVSVDLVRSLIPYLTTVYNTYKEDVKAKFAPKIKHLEEFRIKRYIVNGNERFDLHIDADDNNSCIRAVAFLFYLNDNDGMTVFPFHGINIKPTKGSVLIFPPTWEYPHSGLPPNDSVKYIMSTYIHYGDSRIRHFQHEEI